MILSYWQSRLLFVLVRIHRIDSRYTWTVVSSLLYSPDDSFLF